MLFNFCPSRILISTCSLPFTSVSELQDHLTFWNYHRGQEAGSKCFFHSCCQSWRPHRNALRRKAPQERKGIRLQHQGKAILFQARKRRGHQGESRIHLHCHQLDLLLIFLTLDFSAFSGLGRRSQRNESRRWETPNSSTERSLRKPKDSRYPT